MREDGAAMKVEVFGKANCAVCQSTKRKLAHFIDKWGYMDRVELVNIDMDTVDGMAEGAFRDVGEIPTTIISDGDRDIARWEGAPPPSDEVREILDKCLSAS